jgi:hypothetical protein
VTAPYNFGFPSFATGNAAGEPLQVVGYIPASLPAVTEPTPDEAYRNTVSEHQRVQQEQRQLEEQKAQRAAQQPQTASTKAFSALLSTVKFASAKAVEAKHAVEAQIRMSQSSSEKSLFQKHFPGHTTGENFITMYTCRAIAGDGTSREGNAFLTDRHVLFAASAGLPLLWEVPLASIVSIIRGTALNTSWLHLFTSSNVFCFYDFDTVLRSVGSVLAAGCRGTATDRFHNWVDHMWRAAGGRAATTARSVTRIQPPVTKEPSMSASFTKGAAPAAAPAQPTPDPQLCIICLENAKSAFFQPCGHLVCCVACGNKLSDCPVCRQPIAQKIRAFL